MSNIRPVALSRAGAVDEQHLAWIARSFGRPDYLPLRPRDVEMLVEVGEAVSKYPGTHLFKEGGEAASAYLVESGEIDIYRTADGKRRAVARVGPGSVLGDIAMFGGGTYISSAQAVGRVKAFRFDRDGLLPVLANHPAICMRWLVAGLRQLEETQRRVLHLMHKTVLAQGGRPAPRREPEFDHGEFVAGGHRNSAGRQSPDGQRVAGPPQRTRSR